MVVRCTTSGPMLDGLESGTNSRLGLFSIHIQSEQNDTTGCRARALRHRPEGGSVNVAGEDSDVSGVAGRYATALFDLARDDGAIDTVAGDMTAFKAMLDDSADLRRLVRSPAFSAADQSKALAAVLSKAGASQLTANFMGLIARNRRLFAIEDIIKTFQTLVARHRNQMAAEVTSAVALNDAQVSALKQTLAASTGRDVQLAMKIDPSILGGLVVKLGSRMIDSSLKTKLNALKFAMKEVR
jgi:F-type H+-transporting ATPase subunit delta